MNEIPDVIQLLRVTLTKSKEIRVYINSTSTSWKEILTGEIDGKARLGDIKVSLELNGDDVESRVDPLR